MSLITPYQSCFSAPLLMELTRWRNESAPVFTTIAKRCVGQIAYPLIAVIGLIEGVSRVIFALPSHLCLNQGNVEELHQGIALNFEVSLIALGSLIYNPFSDHLSLDW